MVMGKRALGMQFINNFLPDVLTDAYAPFPELLTFGILPKNIWKNVTLYIHLIHNGRKYRRTS